MIMVNGTKIIPEYFPDGTYRLNLKYINDVFRNSTIGNDNIKVTWHYSQHEEMLLYFVTKHLRSFYQNKLMKLYLPYIPNARMDRVKSNDEVFTLKLFCEFINDLWFDEVIVTDPHSYVSVALLNNVHYDYTDIKHNIEKVLKHKIDYDTIFYPDEGSMKRYSEYIKHPLCMFGIKHRDWESGRIDKLKIVNMSGCNPHNVLIVDDICSYGGTFLHSAKELKKMGVSTIYLYITHCENSILQGELINSGLITRIFTTDSIYTGDHPLIEII